ncbi:hypothetical protein RHAL1_03276 [Beijerinckiaceae bacterium RH AL1]|nr:hypothetical protein [Beijerinckiaceae bacterium]VVB48349.1 hypothetical protein RHCH11_RHCH11_03211 [Beijerinckiaceae bacterium RH CH11]VVB48431.1 hypothetical protein RHAL8_03207 [Beijerinckiaceae bacterium RH AL8]VVC56349.1 hypothetical protein RHAL1_03276 [Beijerinckiaceae bacterium RH AL1]
MPRVTTVLQLRLDAQLKHDFAEAARAQNATPSEAMRELMAGFVRQARRREAERQSRLVAASPDAEATLDDAMRAQAWLFD